MFLQVYFPLGTIHVGRSVICDSGISLSGMCFAHIIIVFHEIEFWSLHVHGSIDQPTNIRASLL